MKTNRNDEIPKEVAVIVAHPDDETLWAGGTLLDHRTWKIFIISLCRGSDSDRAPKFFKNIALLHARGTIGDLDDGPEQRPIPDNKFEEAIIRLLPQKQYDLIITHDPNGEYTRHLRHEETSKAVIKLWNQGKISAKELWTFAYEDGNKHYHPRAIQNATLNVPLSHKTWKQKHQMITETYGFEENSWEALTTPNIEAFWQFNHPNDANKWLKKRGEIS